MLRGDTSFPIALLKESAVAHDSRWMRDCIAHAGAEIAPHGKTTMAAQLFSRQIEGGA